LEIAHSVSRVGEYMGVFSRDTNTRMLHGFIQIYPNPNPGSPQEPLPDVTCPSENDPDACPTELMTAYGVSGNKRMNCGFACSSIKRIPSSSDFYDYNESGIQCAEVDYLSPQFNWCCKTKRVHDTIPKCSDVGVRDTEFGTTSNTNGNMYSTTSDWSSSSEDDNSYIEPTCPDTGCPIENVEEIVDRYSAETSTACDVTDGCDYVMSGDSSVRNSGVSCRQTRRPRHSSLFCCSRNGAYDGQLPSCSDLRAEMRSRRPTATTNTTQDYTTTTTIPQNSQEATTNTTQDYTTTTTIPQNSQEDTTFEVNGRHYHVVLDRKTNEEAKDHCANEVFQGRSGRLYEPKSRYTHDQVVENVNRIAAEHGRNFRLWVGIERNQESNQFQYMTSRDAVVSEVVTLPASSDDYTHDYSSDDGNCVEYWTADVKDWDVVSCAQERKAICEVVF